ncbi:LPS export ABC transporter periplasmic protein LptC [Candidatus Pelagibacter sp.]|nr:LPS export ABC transporter periplasmic protein LptC [Candidatus Pelagibacter sp.]
MNIKKIFAKIIIILLFAGSSFSDEIQIESSKIDVKEEGNLIIAFKADINIPSKEIKIYSNKANYNKIKNTIVFIGDVFLKDTKKNIILKSQKVTYEKNKDLIYTDGDTEIDFKKKYNVKSKSIFYDRKLNEIYGSNEALVEDFDQNFYFLKKKFNLNIFEEILKSNKSIIIDKNYNKYIFEDLVINLKKNEIIGNEIKIEFENSYFGNDSNEPILKGRGGYSNDKELKVYKAVFSTCNIKNKKCRGWELNSNEFTHNKEKKLFEYRESWLKIFDYKAFFLPYFNHPDPTIKRKSGFLTPTYSSSGNLGTSVNIPYFKVLSDDKDLTFNPRFYADKSFLLQNEYRQALKNSNILSDFSFLVGEVGTKGHLFYNQIGKINDITEYELNFQNVRGDNYLKSHKLIETSSLIDNDSLLISNLDIAWKFKDSNLDTSFKIFEDLSRNYHDRYQYIFPDYNFLKNIEIPNDYNGKFIFNSYGYNKNYDTNITEALLTNDFLFSSNEFVNSTGLTTNYSLLLKNSNDYIDKSTGAGEKTNYNLFGTLKVDNKIPLQKKMGNYTHYLQPKMSFRYSPNGNTDLSDKDIMLNYNNVFNLNRINTSSEVESGEALSIGLEFNRKDNKGVNILDFKVANVLKTKDNHKLPSKSKLNKTRSDIFGNLNYRVNNNLKIGYDYSYNRDLKYSNLDQVNMDLSVNNFVTSFSYYSESNDFGDNKNIKNVSRMNINDENKLKFEISKDLKDDFTQYYDLLYLYETDCISFNINYNKSFYRDGDLEPSTSLSFLVKFIPFTELGVPNMGKLINK